MEDKKNARIEILNKNELANSFLKLVDIIYKLRSECPWDKAQTIKSMRAYTIEETFELSESILNNNFLELKAELGDILLHIIFYSIIAEEEKLFSINDVINSLIAKLIKRHPHVFGNVKGLTDADMVKDFWEEKKGRETNMESIKRVPKGMPSFQRALRLQEKARVLNLDWQSPAEVLSKVEEEIQEVKKSIEDKNNDIEIEIGDLLFAIVALCRHLKIDPEIALHKATSKFLLRTEKFMDYCKNKDINPKSLSIDEIESIWREISKEA